MRSAKRGSDTSAVEVANVSRHGLWLYVREQEHFLPFETFPWFASAPIGHIMNVQLLHAEHLYWPDLDVDLCLDAIQHPERYPLVSKVGPDKPAPPSRAHAARARGRGRGGKTATARRRG